MSIASEFGAESALERAGRELAEGYATGTEYAAKITALIIEEQRGKHKEYLRGIFLALEENFS